MTNPKSKTMPSILPSARFRLATSSSTAHSREIGKSRLMISFAGTTGLMAAHMPTTTSRLKILEPMTLLRAISFWPRTAAEMLTAVSGALVPIATIVRPMMTAGTLKIRATEELPSTNRSAPLISRTKPKISQTYIIVNPFFLL